MFSMSEVNGILSIMETSFKLDWLAVGAGAEIVCVITEPVNLTRRDIAGVPSAFGAGAAARPVPPVE